MYVPSHTLVAYCTYLSEPLLFCQKHSLLPVLPFKFNEQKGGEPWTMGFGGNCSANCARYQLGKFLLTWPDCSGSNSGGTTSHNTSIEGNGSDVDQLVAYKVSQLSLSQNNVIFHYLHLDVGEGVFLAPLDPSTSPLHSEVLNQFRAACHIIHANFEMALRSREALRIGGNSKTWNNKNLVAIKEQVNLPTLCPH